MSVERQLRSAPPLHVSEREKSKLVNTIVSSFMGYFNTTVNDDNYQRQIVSIRKEVGRSIPGACISLGVGLGQRFLVIE